jgi:hypothetical protein
LRAALARLGRTGIHAHAFEEVEVDDVEVQVGSRFLLGRVEGLIPVEILERLRLALSGGVVEGGEL